MKTHIAVLLALVVFVGGCTYESSGVPSAPDAPKRDVTTGIWTICDKPTGNLIYVARSGAISVIAGGCR